MQFVTSTQTSKRLRTPRLLEVVGGMVLRCLSAEQGA
jgi:hypothetical protein